MKKLFTLLLLICCSGLALADSSSSVLSPDSVTKFTDMSIYYLTQIFGTVGNVLVGGHAQIMGKLFYTLNWGIFAISGIVIGYAVLIGTVKMASEGVTMSPGKSTVFSFLKLAIGVALIIPNGATGYSAIQEIVMKVVVDGVGLADSMWDTGLNYLSKGGSIWTPPASPMRSNSRADYLSQKNLNALYGTDSSNSNLPLADKIFRDEVCMIGSRSDTHYFSLQTYNHSYNFPGLQDTNAASDHGCGSITWGCSNDNDSDDCQVRRAALSSLITTLMPAAKQFYCESAGAGTSAKCIGSSTSHPKDYYKSVMTNAALGFFSALDILSREQQNNATVQQQRHEAFSNAQKEGWLLAGRYYWDLMQSTGKKEQPDLSTYVQGFAEGPRFSNPGGLSELLLKNAGKQLSTVNQHDSLAEYVKNKFSTDNNEQQPGQYEDSDLINLSFTIPLAIAPHVEMLLIPTLLRMNDAANMFKAENITKHPNPIEFLYNLGQKCITVTETIWFYGALILGGAFLGFGFCEAVSPLATAMKVVTEWVKPLFMMLATLFWGAGFFLSYYVPIYPYMIFLFASIGWFISVIEAMVAAPLVALGLAHPENHDLLGKAEQAIMLLLGVFIQPVLLVLGMIAGIIFSYIAFEILIYTFSEFIVDVLQPLGPHQMSTNIYGAIVHSFASNKTDIFARMFAEPLLFVIFCIILYTLLTQAFSLVYLLRDNVMRWIGAPPSGVPSPEQLTGEIKGGLSTFSQRSGDFGNQLATQYDLSAKAMPSSPTSGGGGPTPQGGETPPPTPPVA